MNAWLPQASYPCGNFSVTSSFNIQNPTSISKGSLGHAYTFRILTGNGDINKAFGYLKRVIVTPAVYLRLVEFLHFDIQSTGQKSHCVNTR